MSLGLQNSKRDTRDYDASKGQVCRRKLQYCGILNSRFLAIVACRFSRRGGECGDSSTTLSGTVIRVAPVGILAALLLL